MSTIQSAGIHACSPLLISWQGYPACGASGGSGLDGLLSRFKPGALSSAADLRSARSAEIGSLECSI